MRGTKGRAQRTFARLALAALLTVSVAAGTATISSARPTKQDLENAKAELSSLNQRLSQLVEDYDQANLRLQETERKLEDARAAADRAGGDAARARAYFGKRAAAAYEGVGSEVELLLGATTLTDFTDRVEFLNDVAQDDVDAANRAQQAGQEATRASADLAQAVRQRQQLLATLDAKRRDIENGIAQQRGLIAQLEKELSEAEVKKIVEDPGPPPDRGGGPPSPLPSPPPPPPPPPPSQGADAAVAAAYSAIGVPYEWGGDDPDEGFDCSGLTMWSWAQGGVSLPHSSAAQYDSIPHVSKDDLQPGDLLFFYAPISHVAIYVGNNQIIHATHPGTTVLIESLTDYWWGVYSGAGRPG